MNRYPVVGDCVQIAGKRSDLVVTASERIPEEFNMEAYVFATIREVDLGKPNPKVTLWQLEGFEKYGTEIKLNDIVFLRQIKIKQIVTYEEK